MAFENFPYADLHTLNLDWILKKIKEADPELLPEEVAKQLQKMIDDGSLADWLDQLYGAIKYKQDFMLPLEDREAYKQDVLANIASWMSVNSLSPCITGPVSTTPARQIFDYAQGKGYAGLFKEGSFVTGDTQTVDGVNYQVSYIDCSTWLSCITKSMYFNSDNPYWMVLADPNTSEADLLNASRENQTMAKPWTIDFYNNISSSRFGYIMTQSGCTLRRLTHKEAGFDMEVNQLLMDNLETGDLIFVARESSYNDDRYRGIFHCAIYLKTLEELNAYGEQYFQTYQPWDTGDPKYGYLVHVRAHGDDPDDHVILCVETLEHMANNIQGTQAWWDTWTCKPWSNAWNDSKCAKRTLLSEHNGNVIRYGTTAATDNWYGGYMARTGDWYGHTFRSGTLSNYRFIETGLEGSSSHPVTAHGYKDVTLTWGETRTNLPRVFTQLVSNSASMDLAYCKIDVISSTATGATIRLFNDSDNTVNMGFYWMAY